MTIIITWRWFVPTFHMKRKRQNKLPTEINMIFYFKEQSHTKRKGAQQAIGHY